MNILGFDKSSNIAIVILSCDKFKMTWKPCIDHFVNAWPNCPYPVYLLNNFIPSNDDRVIDLLVGEDFSWSDSLTKGLLKIEERRVFFIYDDSFISYINVFYVQEIFSVAINHNLDSVTLRINPFDKGTKYNDYLVKLSNETKYRNALFLNLFEKKILLGLLRSGENAWQFEKNGNVRSTSINFFAVKKTTLVTYYHGIVKGKWLPKTKEYLVRKGYSFDGCLMESHSYLKTVGMELYAIIFVVGNKIINRIIKYKD
jgi:hypothetical protein